MSNLRIRRTYINWRWPLRAVGNIASAAGLALIFIFAMFLGEILCAVAQSFR